MAGAATYVPPPIYRGAQWNWSLTVTNGTTPVNVNGWTGHLYGYTNAGRAARLATPDLDVALVGTVDALLVKLTMAQTATVNRALQVYRLFAIDVTNQLGLGVSQEIPLLEGPLTVRW